MKSVLALQVGGGLQDPIRANLTTEESELTAAGVPFTDDSVNGGHEWYVWRILLRDFLTRTAFHAQASSVTSRGIRPGTACRSRACPQVLRIVNS